MGQTLVNLDKIISGNCHKLNNVRRILSRGQAHVGAPVSGWNCTHLSAGAGGTGFSEAIDSGASAAAGASGAGTCSSKGFKGNLLKMEVRWSTVPDKYPNKSAVANWPYWDYYWQFVHYCCICCYCFLESWPLHRHFPMVGDLVEGYPLALSWVQLQGLELLATKIQPELTRGSTYL